MVRDVDSPARAAAHSRSPLLVKSMQRVESLHALDPIAKTAQQLAAIPAVALKVGLRDPAFDDPATAMPNVMLVDAGSN